MKVGVIGGGAAGLMAAYAASLKDEVTLFEKNEKLGKKIYITGKGRCNVTNDCEPEEFIKNVVSNPKFLIGAVYSFPPRNLMELVSSNGVPLKTERGNRVFPVSDKASDITGCFETLLKKNGVNILLGTEVSSVITENGRATGVKTVDREFIFDKIIICTGGLSYPLTGSTGDGYRFAGIAGHSVVAPAPALVGINLKGGDHVALQGLSLKNAGISIFSGNKKIFSDFGEMLFTHFGVSGPVILSASSRINRAEVRGMKLSIDLKPALNEETLDARILRDFDAYKNKDFSNALFDLLPRAMIPVVIGRSGIDPSKKINEVTAKERKTLLHILKDIEFEIDSLRPVEEGIITAGGVSVKEINPKTMESKLVKGLYFAGEVLDVDALTGGFNLHIAFATGYAAGIAG
ncbi:MAG: NAD(P)/FAD-dependent oxidoreductase [Clostridia bacterium]|nr:NAD(P)/FAD-dependent oxidoreductase [Clostridia bacterium]